MHRTCTVTAYDLLDTIVVTVSIKDWDATLPEVGSYEEYAATATISSTGESEPVEWLQQALLGLLETL